MRWSSRQRGRQAARRLAFSFTTATATATAMDDSSRRRRRTTTQPEGNSLLSPSAAGVLDESPYLSPSGRPMRQRSSANLRHASPPAPLAPVPSRPSRASTSRTQKREQQSSPFEQEEEEEEEEYIEEEAMPSRSSRRSTTRVKQPVAPPAAALPVSPPAAPPQQSVPSTSLKVTLGRNRGSARRQKRARLAEEEDAGWMPEIDDDEEAQIVYSTIIAKMQSWMSAHPEVRLTDFFDKVPGGTKFEKPMTLTRIGEKVSKNEYASTIDFEKDIFQLFYNGRRYFEPGTEEYGGVATLQRMYQHMTQSVESAKEDIPDDISAKNYASLMYGPSEDLGEGQGEAPSEGEKEIMPYLRYKGQTIVVGNFVHLSNPTDPSRPIIAQVFKTRSEDLGEGRQDWISACWFLRPEQTKHPRSMLFWPDEALKTSQIVEHHVEDVLEMVCVMYYTKYMKGRPAEGEGGWREGDPLYVCENRFHAEKEQFYKIKNWSGVMPEEVRNKPFDMVEFDQPMAQPNKVKSPFLLGSNGPGAIADEYQRPPAAAPALIRSNSSFLNSGVASPMPGANASGLGSIPRAPHSRVHPETSAVAASGASSTVTKIPQLFKEWSADARAQRKAHAKAKEAKAASEGQLASGGESLAPPAADTTGSAMPPIAQAIDRSVSHTMIQVDVPAYYKTLPVETQQLFHQDAETGNVLWYPAPPILAPSEVNLQRQFNYGEKLPIHSLDYLYYRATEAKIKRKGHP